MPVAQTNLGDLCHYSDTSVMAAALTDINGKILVRTGGGGTWKISAVRVVVQRLLTASTATVTIAQDINDLVQPLDSIPRVFYPEREVCIWLGYVSGLRPVVDADLGSRLLRVFTGVIDIVSAGGSGSGGVTVVLSLRDRMRWLMDSRVTYNPISKNSTEAGRSKIILEIAQRGIGQVDEAGCENCGKVIKTDNYLVDVALQSTVPNANEWYNGPLKAATRQSVQVPGNPSFRIITTRKAVKVQENPDLLIPDQTPLDVIRFLSLQEVYPTDVFQHTDGHFYYVPRGNDGSSLLDPKRFRRTYFFRDSGEEVVDINQMLVAVKQELSTIGLKTNVLVSKTGGNQEGSQIDWAMQLRTTPAILKDIPFACKSMRVSDTTFSGAAEAAIVALAYARVHSRELSATTAVIIGDPSVTVGEIVQILNTPLHPGLSHAASDRQKFLEYNNRYGQLVSDYAKAAKDAGVEDRSGVLPIFDGGSLHYKVDSEAQKNMDALVCSPGSQIRGPNGNAFAELPPSIFRVEGVSHKFNVDSRGYTTELLLQSPF